MANDQMAYLIMMLSAALILAQVLWNRGNMRKGVGRIRAWSKRS